MSSISSSYYYTPALALNRQAMADRALGTMLGMQPEETSELAAAGGGLPLDATQQVGEARQSGESDDRDSGKPRSDYGDVLDLSREYQREYQEAEELSEADERISVRSDDEADAAPAGDAADIGASELTPEEEEQVRELKSRDADVRLHEQQHVAAGGAYVNGGPTYTYQTGPDGKQYAIGGEVSIDMSEVSGDPEATIRKMQTVAAAALAPAEPSGQDQKVAATARQTEAKARQELARQQADETTASGEEPEEGDESNTSGIFQVNRSSAYQAQSRMVSGQTAGATFNAFA